MIEESRSNNSTKTVLVITVGFTVIYFFTKQNIFLYVALIVGILGSVSTYLADKIDWVWTKLSWLLSLIVPNIVMTVIFYVVLTPTALLSRLFGKSDPLGLRNTESTLFVEKKETSLNKESFEKPW